jgi:hypothetical protein
LQRVLALLIKPAIGVIGDLDGSALGLSFQKMSGEAYLVQGQAHPQDRQDEGDDDHPPASRGSNHRSAISISGQSRHCFGARTGTGYGTYSMGSA